MTALSRTLQKSDELAALARPGSAGRQRTSRMSGWMPIERSSLTECWVGLVFSSPAAGMNGISVRWT